MFKMCLRDARELNGLTVDEVARYCGIKEDEYNIVENDTSQAELSLMLKITTFLGLTLGMVFPGNKADCLSYNRSQLLAKNDAHILITQLSKNSKIS